MFSASKRSSLVFRVSHDMTRSSRLFCTQATATRGVKTLNDIPGSFDASNDISTLLCKNPFDPVDKISKEYPNESLYKCLYYGMPSVMTLDVVSMHKGASLEVKNEAQYLVPPAWQEYFGNYTLLDRTGENHGKRKREIVNTMTPKIISNPLYSDVISNDLLKLFKKMDNIAKTQGNIDFLQEFRKFSWRAGLKLMLSNEVVDYFEENDSSIMDECVKLGAMTYTGIMTTVDVNEAKKDSQCPFSVGMQANEKLREILKPMIEESRKLYENGKLDENTCVYKLFNDTPLLSDNNNDITSFDYINVMQFAATDTTANTMCSVLYCIYKNEDKFNKLKNEILNNNYDIHSNDDYLHWFMRETLRLHPIGNGIARAVTAETTLGDYTSHRINNSNNSNENDNNNDEHHSGVLIPPGIGVFMPTYYLQHCEKYWGKNSFDFIPERFDKNVLTRDQKKAYMPFGKGNRLCGGITYAQLQLKSFILKLIENNINIDIDENTVVLDDYTVMGRAKFEGKLTM